jgi:hypothetical protein
MNVQYHKTDQVNSEGSWPGEELCLPGTNDAFPETEFPIQIPDGTDLNAINSDEPSGFPQEVFENLPDTLRDACNQLSDKTDKEVFLFTALGFISGVLPNVHGFYDYQFYESNLFCYVLAPFGTGKGFIKMAYSLIKPIHLYRKEIYECELAAYKEEVRKFKKEIIDSEPSKPGRKLLVAPANNSKSGLIQLLDENQGRAILYEQEGDTLADALKQEQGNFSDILRKAFHHEPITINRRAGDENREIELPCLSVVLSSTFDQYRKLIPNIQNGLFSRFMHYNLNGTSEFRNVFDTSRRSYSAYFDSLGQTFLSIYKHLENLSDEPIEIKLTGSQQTHFVDIFREWKCEFGEYVSKDMEGSINRLGLICFRISMILTSVRHFCEGDFSPALYCSDVDFENALLITETVKRQALRIFHQLPQPAVSKEFSEAEREVHEKAGQIAQARYLRTTGQSYAEISRIVLGDAKLKPKIHRWLNS